MAEPTITQIFGTGATRLANGAAAPSAGLFIPDSVLVAAGLTTPDTATAEGHLTAIILTCKDYLTETNFGNNIDQSIYIANGFTSNSTRGTNNDPYTVRQITLNFAKLDQSSITPNDY